MITNKERVGSMTPNQIIFADEYLKHRNATRAYLTAYPNVKNADVAQKNGSRLLRNQNVTEYIDRQMAAIHKRTIADAAEIMEYFTAVMRGEVNEDTVTPSGVTLRTDAKISDRNAAAEKLARMLGADKKVERERLKIEKKRLKIEQAKAGDDPDAESVEIIV